MNKFEFVKLDELNVDAWEAFIQSVENPTFFASVDYLKTFGSNVFVMLKKDNDEIIAGLPFVIQSLVPVIGRFFQICRIETEVIISNSFSFDQNQELKQQFLNELIQFLKNQSVANLYITTKIRSKDGKIYSNLGFDVNECGTYILGIEPEIELIIKNFSKGHKSSVQKAIKSGVEIKIYQNKDAIDHISDFIDTQKKLFERRQDTMSVVYHKSEKFLKSIFTSNHHKVLFAVAKYKDKTAATGIFLSIKDQLFYYAGNSDYELVRECQASNLLQLEVIKYAKELGIKTYDFGGADVVLDPESELYGVTLFKRGFGGVLQTYDYAKLEVNPLRSKILISISKLQNSKLLRVIYKMLKNAEK